MGNDNLFCENLLRWGMENINSLAIKNFENLIFKDNCILKNIFYQECRFKRIADTEVFLFHDMQRQRMHTRKQEQLTYIFSSNH